MAEITRDQAWELLTEFNKDPFHLHHAQIVEGCMRYFAKSVFVKVCVLGNSATNLRFCAGVR